MTELDADTVTIKLNTSNWDNPPNPYERISEIAARVGVKPKSGDGMSIVMRGADGQTYDVFEVVIAVIDKLERATTVGE